VGPLAGDLLRLHHAAGLVTGIITHKKIFKEFFTFRPGKGQRSWLDGHNAIGVLVLPFHLMISYSSLVIFMYMVMPASIMASYGDTGDYFNDLFGRDQTPRLAGVAAPWRHCRAVRQGTGAGAGRAHWLHPGAEPWRRQCPVTFSRASADSVAYKRSANWTFDGVSGALLSQGAPESAAMMTSFTFVGLHMGNFAGPWLRWLYFAFRRGRHGGDRHGPGDVAGQTPAQARQERAYAGRAAPGRGAQHRQHERPAARRGGVLLGQPPAAGGVARACRLGGQRLLPGLGPGAGACRAAPGRRAWGEQLALGALAFALLPLLNALTTGQGLEPFHCRR
jgi:hypothetical protein